MPLNTLYQVRARQKWGSDSGQEMESVFFFNHTAGDGVAEDLGLSFGTAIGAAINAVQTGVMKNYSIDVINLGDLGDFASLPWLGTGSISGDTLPPTVALSFTFKVNTRAVRKGSKRVSGVPEAAVLQGIITDADYKADIEALRLVMQQEIVSADDTWLPVVVKRIKEPVVGTVPLRYTYRLPTVGDPLTLGEVVVVLTSDIVKHQVSRQLG